MASCAQNEKSKINELEKIYVNPDEISNINLSDFCKSIKYLRLETDTNSYIVSIDKMIRVNKSLYILDKGGNKILVFNDQGKYLFNIGSIGKGPGQYALIGDFIIDCKKEELEIYDINQKKMQVFNLTGKFKYEREMPYMFIFMEKLSDNCYALQTRKLPNFVNGNEINYDVLLIKNNNEIISKHFNYDPSIKVNGGSIDLTKVFVWDRDDLYLAKLFIDTVYKLNRTNLNPEPMMLFNYGKYSLPTNMRNLKFDKALKLINSPGKYAFGHEILSISDSLLCFTYGFNKPIFSKRYLGLFFRKTLAMVSIDSVINDIDGVPLTIPIAAYSDTLVYAVYPERMPNSAIKNTINSEKFIGWNETDNPILIFMKIKNP